MASAKEILLRLSFGVKSKGADQLIVTAPVFRVDISIEADVAEELARVFGYNKLGLTMPKVNMKPSVVDDMLKLQSEIRNMSVRLGFTELLQPSFYGKEKIAWAMLPESEHRTVANPMDSEQQFLRTDLLPGMISVVERNRKAFSRVTFFEIGQVFWKQMKPGGFEWRIAWTASFQDGGELIEMQENIAELFVLTLGVAKRDIYISSGTHIRDIKIGTTPVGILIVRPLRKGMTVACVECSLHELLANKKIREYIPRSKFPSVFRDISVIVPVSMDSFTLRRQLHRLRRMLLRANFLTCIRSLMLPSLAHFILSLHPMIILWIHVKLIQK
jgi:phenylalanyl-tRNA synthetase beta subunit